MRVTVNWRLLVGYSLCPKVLPSGLIGIGWPKGSYERALIHVTGVLIFFHNPLRPKYSHTASTINRWNVEKYRLSSSDRENAAPFSSDRKKKSRGLSKPCVFSMFSYVGERQVTPTNDEERKPRNQGGTSGDIRREQTRDSSRCDSPQFGCQRFVYDGRKRPDQCGSSQRRDDCKVWRQNGA